MDKNPDDVYNKAKEEAAARRARETAALVDVPVPFISSPLWTP